MKTGNMNLRSTVPHTIVPAVDQTSLHVEQRIYMSLLCEAKECSSNVKEFNQYAKATVKVSAIAVSLLPLPGASFIGAALSVGADAALLVTEYDSANKEAKLMEGGALAGGFGNNYNPSFADRIKSIKSNEASADRLILGIGNSILDEVLTMGSAEIATLGLTAVISKALETTNPVGSLRTLIFPLLKAAETTADLSQKTLIRQTITKLKKPGVLENVVDKSIKSVEVTKDLNEAFDDLPSN
jgi:hypothetical protein